MNNFETVPIGTSKAMAELRTERDALARDLEAERYHRRALEESEQTLAAHVERLTDAATRYYNATCGEQMINIESAVKSKIDEVNAAIDEIESAVKSTPATSLTRLKADTAAHEADVALEVVRNADNAPAAIQALENRAAHLRRQAEEVQP